MILHIVPSRTRLNKHVLYFLYKLSILLATIAGEPPSKIGAPRGILTIVSSGQFVGYSIFKTYDVYFAHLLITIWVVYMNIFVDD